MKSAWNIMSHFSSYKEWVLLTKNCTKSPSRSMLSGKLSRKLSRKLKKMMFDGPFLIRIAVRPLKSTDKQKNIKIITCSILENPRRNRLSGRRAGCFETVQNISAENLSLTKQDRFEIHISTKKYLLNPCKYLVQHQGLNALKRRQKRFGAPGQESRRYQGGVGVDSLWPKN